MDKNSQRKRRKFQ